MLLLVLAVVTHLAMLLLWLPSPHWLLARRRRLMRMERMCTLMIVKWL